VSERFPVSRPIDLRGRVAVVTGAARGIGRVIALALAREGADIMVADVLPTGDTVGRVGESGRRAIGARCDVTRGGDVSALVEDTMQAFGRIDVLVNNAGVLHRSGLEDTTAQTWYRDLDVTLTGAFRVTQAVFPIMKRQGYGKIVNISSVSGKIGGTVSKATGDPGVASGRSGPAYAAAKGGLLAFTRWVAKDGGQYGIWCNAVCPGPVESEMTRGFQYGVENLPIPRMAQPEDIAEAVVFLASPAANYVTGQALNVDGGMVMD